MKDHLIAQKVNELTQIARDFHDTQQLRARIADAIVDLLKQVPDSPAEPCHSVRNYMYSDPYWQQFSQQNNQAAMNSDAAIQWMQSGRDPKEPT